MVSPSRSVKFTTIGLALIAAVGLSFVGGMAYQGGVDHPLIGQYAPPTTTNLTRTRGGSGNTGSAATGSAASTSGGAAQP